MKTAFRQNMGVPFKLCLSQNRQNHQTGSQQNPYTIQQRRQESKTKLDWFKQYLKATLKIPTPHSEGYGYLSFPKLHLDAKLDT